MGAIQIGRSRSVHVCQTRSAACLAALTPGVISQSTLQAGGYVHGVLPKALVTRASEFTERPHSSAAPTPPPVASAEGKGADLLADDFGGRLSMEVVGSMHEVSLRVFPLRGVMRAIRGNCGHRNADDSSDSSVFPLWCDAYALFLL